MRAIPINYKQSRLFSRTRDANRYLYFHWSIQFSLPFEDDNFEFEYVKDMRKIVEIMRNSQNVMSFIRTSTYSL